MQVMQEKQGCEPSQTEEVKKKQIQKSNPMCRNEHWVNSFGFFWITYAMNQKTTNY